MKKLVLLTLLVAFSFAGFAQPLYLSGASPHTENFNGITTAPPAGWYFYIGSSPTFIGTTVSYNPSLTFGVFDTANVLCTGSVRAAGFKNFASGNVAHATDTCDQQNAYTDRAIGVRQVGPSSTAGYDSGAAFVLKLANTHGMSAVGVNFKLQSLDITSARTTTWKLQYGMGATPTVWTTVTPTGTMTTGGGTFTNNNISASFGTALDDQSGTVCIRLVTLDYSSGSGNRPSTAIDDFNITWTGTAKTGVSEVVAAPALDLTVLGDASSNNITFGYNTENEGKFNFVITDISGRVIHSENIEAVHGDQKISVNGLNLASGMYFAKMSNGNSSAVAKVNVQ